MPVKDHLGNEFPHTRAMLKFWRIHPMVYSRLKARGYTLQQILDKDSRPPVVKRPKKKREKIVDFRGIEYPNLLAMCKKFHIEKSTFLAREEEGLSLRECLLGEDEDRRCLIMPKQANYSDLIKEFGRLETKVNALRKYEKNLLGIDAHHTELLIKRVEEAGVAISTAVSYANALLAKS